MDALHGAFRRDLDQLLNTTADSAAIRARWEIFAASSTSTSRGSTDTVEPHGAEPSGPALAPRRLACLDELCETFSFAAQGTSNWPDMRAGLAVAHRAIRHLRHRHRFSAHPSYCSR